jgi:hypothetical protein
MPLPDFSTLPDFPPLPDLSPPQRGWVAAILVDDEAVLFLRRSGHRSYSTLPGGFVEDGETPERACLRTAKTDIVKAIRDLPRRLEINFKEDDLVISLGPKIHEAKWDRRTVHLFRVLYQGSLDLCGPKMLPRFPPDVNFWRPYEWVPFTDLRSKVLVPWEIAACELVRDSIRAAGSPN